MPPNASSSAPIRISAFRWVPPFAQGLVRDLRLRWALEEASLPYEVRLIGPEDQSTPAYRAMQPFGQVPVYEEGDLCLFESGAIVHHIAQKTPVLLPPDAKGRARALAWMFAALNSVEPYIQGIYEVDVFQVKTDWAAGRRPLVFDFVRRRLDALVAALGDREYFEDRFTAGDLMMTTVLRNLRITDLLKQRPTLDAYRLRCEARPAFARALSGQMSAFEANAPPAA
jgi:glutathione S-transferase